MGKDLKTMRRLAQAAGVVTVATSPDFIEQTTALSLIQRFLQS